MEAFSGSSIAAERLNKPRPPRKTTELNLRLEGRPEEGGFTAPTARLTEESMRLSKLSKIAAREHSSSSSFSSGLFYYYHILFSVFVILLLRVFVS